MLSVTRSPLASPAHRTVASASSHIVTPSSPLSRPPYPSPAHTRSFASVRTPRDSYASGPGASVHGSYFNLVGVSTMACRYNVPCSPASAKSPAPSPLPISISSTLCCGNTNHAVQQLGLDRLAINSPSIKTSGMSLDAQPCRKPTFKLALPRPTLFRDETVTPADALFSLATPGALTWSDSFDSVMTLKPIKGRVPTPYPKIDDSEWIEDVDSALGTV